MVDEFFTVEKNIYTHTHIYLLSGHLKIMTILLRKQPTKSYPIFGSVGRQYNRSSKSSK
jgi:hypothetical protein